MRIPLLIVLLLFPAILSATEYTIKRSVTVEETGYSPSGDPVEAFENAIENAKKTAARMIQSRIRGGSATEEGRLSSDWVEKKANVQIFNVRVIEKIFIEPGEVRVRIRMTAGYLHYARFWAEYDKTVAGATHRTMALPGWGQIYNRELFSAGLFGAFYAFFYGTYALQIRSANSDADRNEAFLRYQLPGLVFWTLAVSDAGISRLMSKAGLEQIKKSYQASSPPSPDSLLSINLPLWHRRF